MLGVEEGAECGDAHRPFEGFRGLVEHAPAAEQGGIVHQDVDPAPPPEDVADVALDRGLVRHVAWRGHGLAAVPLDPGDACLDRRLVHVVARDLGAVSGQGQGDAAADVGAGAGDEGHLAFERDVQGCYLSAALAGASHDRTSWHASGMTHGSTPQAGPLRR
jgi:hypothetical protein